MDRVSSANLRRDEAAARSAAISVDTATVQLDLRDAPDLTRTDFPTVTTLRFAATASETWIDFLGVAVDRVEVNGVPQSVEWDGARVRVRDLADHNVVRVHARGRYSTSGEGLHRFVDPVDESVYLYTHYEPADCRRVYPCFEQPDLKARWTFEVTAPAAWPVLSNAVVAARTDVPGGAKTTFAETLPLSSYITAVAAGPYHRVDGHWTGERQSVDLGVLCRASLAAHLDAEEILDVTCRGLAFYTEVFGDYPWGKYDQIFVPEYNIGAMENPGLVTFTESYLFRGAATAAQHEARATTILHEMAHMWFGDLVTMRWWDDLWLKESFADYMGTHAAAAAGGFPEAWITFASRRKAWAYAQDQLPTTHPIVADIVDLEAAKLNFDGITYAKGAAVLKQLVAFIGEEAFFATARRYFAEHAYGNTTLADLLSALETASGRDLRAWSSAWLQTTGPSEIAIERGGEPVLIQTDPRPHRLGVGFFGLSGGRLTRRGDVALDVLDARTPITAPALPDVELLLPNDGDLTYAKVRLDARSLDAVATGLSTIHDPLARAVVWSAVWNATRDGELAAASYLAIVQRHAPAESNIALLADVLGHAAFAVEHYVRPDTRPRHRRAWLDTCWSTLWAAAAGSDAQLAWARALGTAASVDDTHAPALREILAGRAAAPAGLPLDPDLRWGWLFALAASGQADTTDADEEFARDATATGRTSRIAVLAARPEPVVRAEAWAAAWTDQALTNDHLDATISGIRAGGRRDLVARFDADYFARLRSVWRERSIEIAGRLVRGLFPAAETTDDVDAWLADNADAPGALRRIVMEQRDHLARDLRVRGVQPI